ncbi:outer membrane protein transport protein [Sansalvadorimonas sp. 2012CJ34-2]|uniref:Outer membrane protein transport protein n=1 Tax=Parendozoicomonas callyspongiae TaxID=2942213 RepID=A0ABT0PB79_9GAMM|nr:porin [Sansalvadorimonas sp. 2012CJ34-2]MCL6268637.1 outer membrane protein transport protein [Sansalvadorimonas sp. 2012CJ34-2]
MNYKGLSRAFTLSALFAAMLPAMQANAAAFQVAEHSAAGVGRAFAGEAATAEDASTIARNVAGMAFLDGPTFTGTVSYIKPNIEIENTTPTPTGLTDPNYPYGDYKGKVQKDVAPAAVVPVFYYVTPVNDKVSVGFAGYTNFGFSTEYDTESGMTLPAKKSDIMTYNLNASVAYKLQDNLSIGFGLNAVYLEAALSNVALVAPDTFRTALDMEGDDWSYNWSAGVLWQPLEHTRLGFSYTSEVDATLEGKNKSQVYNGTVVANVNPLGLNFNTNGSADLTLPSIAELSILQQLNDQLSVHASYQKIGWSSLEKLTIKLDGVPAAAHPEEIFEYKDVSRWSVGATYKYSEDWTFRTGYAYDNSPVSDEHRSFRIPDGDREWFSVGASYTIDSNQKLDAGYAYLTGKESEIHYTSSTGIKVDGKIKKSNAHILSLQYNYKF